MRFFTFFKILLLPYGEKDEYETLSAMRSRYEARQRHGWLKSRPEFKTVNKYNSGRHFCVCRRVLCAKLVVATSSESFLDLFC